MAISVTNIGTASSASTQSLSLTIPAGGVPSGAFIYASCTKNSSSSAATFTDTSGNVYIANYPERYLGGVTSNGYFRQFWIGGCAALVSGNVLTFADTSVAASATTISAIYATGIKQVSDPVYTGTATSGTGTTGTRTLSLASEYLAIGVTSIRNSSTITQPAGFSALPNAVNSTIYQDGANLVSSSGGSVTYNPSWGTSSAFTVNLMLFYAQPPNNNFLMMF